MTDDVHDIISLTVLSANPKCLIRTLQLVLPNQTQQQELKPRLQEHKPSNQ